MKKRVLSCIALISLMFVFACVSVAAAEALVTVSNVNAKIGGTVDISVALSGNTGFSNLAIQIGYNSDVMTLTNATSPVSGASFTTAPYYTANPYNMQWDSADNVTYNGTLAVLTFTIENSTEIGEYPVTIDFYKGRSGNNVDGDDVNYRSDYEPLPLTYKGGSITVSGGSTDPAEGTVCVQTKKVFAEAGDTVEMPVVLSGNTGFSNLAIEIGYDSKVMTLTDVTSSVNGVSFTTAPDYSVNPFNMQWDSANDVTYNGILAMLTFRIKTDTADGTYPVTVDYYKGRGGSNVDGYDVNYDEAYEPLSLTYTSGSIVVGETGKYSMDIVEMDIPNRSFGVSLTADDYTGDIWVGLYDASGRLVSVRQYTAAEYVNVTFDKDTAGVCAKVMWLNSSSFKPLCEAKLIPLK